MRLKISLLVITLALIPVLSHTQTKTAPEQIRNWQSEVTPPVATGNGTQIRLNQTTIDPTVISAWSDLVSIGGYDHYLIAVLPDQPDPQLITCLYPITQPGGSGCSETSPLWFSKLSLYTTVSSATLHPGDSVMLTFNVQNTYPGVVAVQWTLNLPPDLSASNYTIFPGSDKQLSCLGNKCLVFGLNTTLLSSPLATVTLTVSPSAQPETLRFYLSNVISAGATGNYTPITVGPEGLLTVIAQ